MVVWKCIVIKCVYVCLCVLFAVVIYCVLVVMLVSRSAMLVKENKSAVQRKLLYIATGFYLGGFLFLWLPEHALCDIVHPLESRPANVERLQLHAWFHLTSTVGPYAYLLFSEMEHFERHGARLDTQTYLLPTVVVPAAGKSRKA